jgi:hypothetical protein
MLQPEMRCVEFVEAVTEWMEGVLDDDERVVLEEHLAICPHCLDYLGELRLAIGVLRATDADTTRHPDASGRSSTPGVTVTRGGGEPRAVESPPPAMRAALLAAFRDRFRG